MSSHSKFVPRRSRLVIDQEARNRHYPVLTRIDTGISILILVGLVVAMGIVTYEIAGTAENLEAVRYFLRGMKSPL